jgi:hypothetical protein
MIRTQVQLKEDQITWLRKKSKDSGVSISQLIREGIDLYRSKEDLLPAEKRKKALSAIGRFSSGQKEISVQHDKYLVDAYRGEYS